MALDDFATEDQLVSEEAAPVLVDPADEDLFDFPAVKTVGLGPSGSSAPLTQAGSAGTGLAESEEVRAPLPSQPLAPTGTPLATAKNAPTPAPVAAAPTRAEPAATTRPYPPYDPALDEDIFNFGELFTPAESKAGNEFLTKAEVLASAPAKTNSPPPAGTPTPPTPSASAAVPAAKPAKAETQTIAAAAPPAASTTTDRPGAQVASPKEQRRLALPSPAMQLVLGAIVVVQAAFVFFAWQASRTFRDAVDSARQELVTPRVGGSDTGPIAWPETATSTTTTSAGDPALDTSTYQSVPSIDEWVSEAAAPWDISIRIAERDIEEGEFSAARRLLYSLLATQDRQGMPESSVADVMFLIARSWSVQSSALAQAADEELKE